MFKYILFLFVTVPLLELYVLIEVGRGIGGIWTIALCLFTAALGGFIIRIQGLLTLLDAQKHLAQGEVPTAHVLYGLMLAVAGLLLFTPGLVTDTLGFLLLVPAVRKLIAHWFMARADNRPHRHREGDVIDAEVVVDQQPTTEKRIEVNRHD